MWNPFAEGAKGAVEGLGLAVKEAVSAFKADPTKVLELEKEIQIAILTAQSNVLGVVNESMQAESKSEHWAQWLWRPTFGFTGAAILINNYILLPYFSKLGIVPIPVPTEVWLMLMAVLGVAAWTRGQEKIEAAK